MPVTTDHEKDILAAYDDVRNDKTDTNWLLLEYVDGKDVVNVTKTGAGGLEEFKQHLMADQAAFGYIRYVYTNDGLSQRAKFLLVSWCGPEVKVMRKAKLTVQIAEVKTLLKSYAVEFQTSDLHDLDEKEVQIKVKKAAGANCTL